MFETPGPRGLLLLLCGLSSAWAQSDLSPTPTPAAEAKNAHVRFWNMMNPPSGAPPGVGALEILGSANELLSTAPPGNFFAGYFPLKPGAYNFTIRKVGDPENPLKRLPINLRADQYVTILASNVTVPPAILSVDDTIDPQTAPDAHGRLTVRQFMPDAKMTVALNKTIKSAELNYGDVAVLENLPSEVVTLDMVGMVKGAAKTWSMDADFSKHKHATLLVVADVYGRFRPRISFDGVPAEGMPDAAPRAPSRSPVPAVTPTPQAPR